MSEITRVMEALGVCQGCRWAGEWRALFFDDAPMRSMVCPECGGPEFKVWDDEGRLYAVGAPKP